MEKKISIITAVYNGENLLPNLIESLCKQTYKNFQFILIDGGSKDKTVNVIRKYENIINFWISEPDNGIYDAWNKGLEKATGDWIMFLGCDDILVPNALNSYCAFIDNLQNKEEIELISSKAKVIDKKGNAIRIKGWPFQWPLFLKDMSIAHPGALHSKKFFKNYGVFNTNYKIVGDYELLLRAGGNLRTAFMNEVTVLMNGGGVSDSIQAVKEHYKAVTTTGKYPRYKAFLNASIVFLKYNIRKLARKVGVNIYLRKA